MFSSMIPNSSALRGKQSRPSRRVEQSNLCRSHRFSCSSVSSRTAASKQLLRTIARTPVQCMSLIVHAICAICTVKTLGGSNICSLQRKRQHSITKQFCWQYQRFGFYYEQVIESLQTILKNNISLLAFVAYLSSWVTIASAASGYL